MMDSEVLIPLRFDDGSGMLPDGRMVKPGDPDLEGFDLLVNPDREEERAKLRGLSADSVWIDELARVYGEEHILTPEQVAANQLAARKRKRWPEVRKLRRLWKERAAIYGEGSDFGAF